MQELLTLAVALDVPPVWLLGDPTDEHTVPVTPGLVPDAWSALLWMTGKRRLDLPFRNTGTWTAAEYAIEKASQAATSLVLLEQLRRNHDLARMALGENYDEAGNDEPDRQVLTVLADRLRDLVRAGYAVPEIPEYARLRAEQLGVVLTAAEG